MVGPPGLSVEGCLHPRLAVFAYPINDVVQTLQAINHQSSKKSNKTAKAEHTFAKIGLIK